MTFRVEESSNHGKDLSRAGTFETATDDERLSSLRDLVLMLLREMQLLQIDPPPPANCGVGGLQNQVQRFESDLIRQALNRTAGNQARAARLLGVKPTTLNAKIRRYQISVIGQPQESEPIVQTHVIAA